MKRLFLGLAAAVAMFVGPAAHASDYGCKVLLCLANPNGPRAVSECVPPINQLFRDLARGRSFPTCELAESPSGGGRSWAQRGVSYYDPCPGGTTALASGSYAVLGGATPPSYGSLYYTGIGDGEGLYPSHGDNYRPMPGKVCVGNLVGNTSVMTGYGDGYSSVSSGVYDRVEMLDAQGSPNIIDVFVDSTLYRRVRW